MSDIELVIFDCDGVLVDSEPLSADALVDVLRPLGVVMSRDYVFDKLVGRNFSTVSRYIERDFQIDLPENFETDYRQVLRKVFRHKLAATRGLQEVLSSLAVPCCVATSSTPERVAFTLETVGLARWFTRAVFSASQVERSKPAPDLFIFAAERMNAPAERCLVIEDSLVGVAAGLAAGMQVVRYVGGGHLSHRTYHTGEFPEAVGILADWGSFFDLYPHLTKK